MLIINSCEIGFEETLPQFEGNDIKSQTSERGWAQELRFQLLVKYLKMFDVPILTSFFQLH